MSTPVHHTITIYQGTTQRVPLVRRYLPYAAKLDGCGGYVHACTDEPVDEGDFHNEDYAGCAARMQLRDDVDAKAVLWEMTTAKGNIALDGNTLTLIFEPADTEGFTFESATGQVEVVRPNGDVERQYDLRFKVSRESTK